MTSAYSGYWEDEAGGKIKYDRNGRIRDVEFQGGGRVVLGSEAGGSRIGNEAGDGGGQGKGGSGGDFKQEQHQRGGIDGGNWI